MVINKYIIVFKYGGIKEVLNIRKRLSELDTQLEKDVMFLSLSMITFARMILKLDEKYNITAWRLQIAEDIGKVVALQDFSNVLIKLFELNVFKEGRGLKEFLEFFDVYLKISNDVVLECAKRDKEKRVETINN